MIARDAPQGAVHKRLRQLGGGVRNPKKCPTQFIDAPLVRKQSRVNVFARESNMYSFAQKEQYYVEIERKIKQQRFYFFWSTTLFDIFSRYNWTLIAENGSNIYFQNCYYFSHSALCNVNRSWIGHLPHYPLTQPFEQNAIKSQLP